MNEPANRFEQLDLVASSIKGKMCVEIGVLQGHFSAEILKREPGDLHLVDPWIPQEKKAYNDFLDLTPDCFEDLHARVKARFKDNLNVHVHRMYSHEFFRSVKREYSFAHIDGNHSYAHCFSDIFMAYMHMKEGGVIMVHDYNPGPDINFPGVAQACISFCNISGNEIESISQESFGAAAIRIRK